MRLAGVVLVGVLLPSCGGEANDKRPRENVVACISGGGPYGGFTVCSDAGVLPNLSDLCHYAGPRAENDPFRVPCEPGALFCDGNEMRQCVVLDNSCLGWAALAPYASSQACEQAIVDGTGPRYL